MSRSGRERDWEGDNGKGTAEEVKRNPCAFNSQTAAPQEDLLLLFRRAPSRPSDIVSLTIPCCLAMVAEVAQEQGVYNVTLQVRRTPFE